MRYAYFVVEGPHDLELVARVLRCDPLKRYRLRRIINISDLHSYWQPLVPTRFPPDGDLLKRVDMPVFFQGEQLSLALHAVGGDSRIVHSMEETLTLLPHPPDAVGALLDADTDVTAAQRFDMIRAGLAPLKLSVPSAAGVVADGPPRCGVFVLPDNTSQGTLEDLLMECAAESYPDLLAAARVLVAGVDPTRYKPTHGDMKEFTRNAGRNKATVGCITAVLKPGKAVQTSIQDNRWIDTPTLVLPRIAAVHGFLADLFGCRDQ